MPVSTAALIWRGDRLLFVRRPPGGDLSECWELPGGKVDPGEAPEEALRRELREELGIEARVGGIAGEAAFEHARERFRLIGFHVEADLETLELREHQAYGFYTTREARQLELAPSDVSLLDSLDAG
jgi:8-oxo-dGTP diphosphatase